MSVEFVGRTYVVLFQLASQPASVPPAVAASPPPFRYACLPEPAGGIQPPLNAATNWRYLPTVTRYLSRRKLLTAAGSA